MTSLTLRKGWIFILDFMETLYLIPGIVIGFTLHEYAHAWTAVWLGDDTPKHQGRLSVNPFVHIDIIGFIMILLAGFGWAKPVEINPNNFKHKKRDGIIVSLAGPLMNLLIAFYFLILMVIAYYIPENILGGYYYEIIMNIFDYAVWINIVLFIFNLIPIPPLDGSHILFGLTGLKDSSFYYTLYDKSKYLLLILIFTDLIGKLFYPPIVWTYDSLINLFFY